MPPKKFGVSHLSVPLSLAQGGSQKTQDENARPLPLLLPGTAESGEEMANQSDGGVAPIKSKKKLISKESFKI